MASAPGPQQIGVVLADITAKRGWTWRALARRLHVHEQYLGKVRRDEKAISPKSIGRWIKALELDDEERRRFEDAAVWSQFSPTQRAWVVNFLSRQ